jgi:superfamily I DNA and/or RNA helicase
MAFSSTEFYDGDLQAHTSVHAHLLCDIPRVGRNALTESALSFIDTAGAGFEEETEPDGESRLNRQEATLICRQARKLLNSGVQPAALAIIAPYAAQVRLLRQELDVPGVEVDTVDGFQGREKEAVIISLVRSNQQGDIGFLADVRRMNVAMTRARRLLLVAGDSATLSSHPFYRRLFEYIEQLGAYRSVWEVCEE